MNATELTLSPWRETSRVSEFRYQCTPRLTGRVRAVPVVGARLCDVAPAAQGLKVRPVVWIAALVLRDHVIAFKSAGLATANAPPVVPLEYPKSQERPYLAVQGGVVPRAGTFTAHRPTA